MGTLFLMLATHLSSLPFHILFLISKKDQFACIFQGAVQPHACTCWHILSPCLECHSSSFPSFRTTIKGQLLGNFTSGRHPSSHQGHCPLSPYHTVWNYFLNVYLLDSDLLGVWHVFFTSMPHTVPGAKEGLNRYRWKRWRIRWSWRNKKEGRGNAHCISGRMEDDPCVKAT